MTRRTVARTWTIAASPLIFVLGCTARPPVAPPPAQSPAVTKNVPPTPTQPAPAASQPGIALKGYEVGRSVEGAPLVVHTFGDATLASPAVLILGGIHGNEGQSEVVCRRLAELLAARPELAAGRRVVVMPAANPDGLAKRLRTNAGRVDLNRNFPATNWAKSRKGAFHGGAAPADQPETRALVEMVERVRPALIVSVHTMAQPCNNHDGPAEAEAVARVMAGLNGYPIRASIGYPTPGSFGSWAGIDRRIPTITLELPSNRPAAESWERNREALLAAIRSAAAHPKPQTRASR